MAIDRGRIDWLVRDGGMRCRLRGEYEFRECERARLLEHVLIRNGGYKRRWRAIMYGRWLAMVDSEAMRRSWSSIGCCTAGRAHAWTWCRLCICRCLHR